MSLRVDRAKRLGQRRDRLQRGTDDERLAVRHPALDPSGAVGLAVPAPLLGPEDLVVRLRARSPSHLPRLPHRDALHRLDRDQSLGEAAVEPGVPARVRAESGHEPEGTNLEDAAEALVRLPEPIDLGDHRLARLGVQAANRRLVDGIEVLRPEVLALRGSDRADLDHMAVNARPEGAQELLRQRSGRHPGRRLASAGALEDVANVGLAELEQPGQVGVAWARRVDLLDLRVHRPRAHPLLPVRVVAIGDQHGHRAAERPPVPNAGADLDRVAFDLHPPAPTVPELPPGHLAIQAPAVELQAGRQALDDRDQSRPVRFAGRSEAKRHGRRLTSGSRAPGRRPPREAGALQVYGVSEPWGPTAPSGPAACLGCGCWPPRFLVTTFLIARSFSLYGVPGSGE